MIFTSITMKLCELFIRAPYKYQVDLNETLKELDEESIFKE